MPLSPQIHVLGPTWTTSIDSAQKTLSSNSLLRTLSHNFCISFTASPSFQLPAINHPHFSLSLSLCLSINTLKGRRTEEAILGALMNPISTVSASASVNQMATFFLAPKYVLGSSSDCGHTLQFRSNNNSRSGQLFHRKWHGSRGGISVSRGFRVLCQSKVIPQHPFESSICFLWKRIP